MAARFWLYLTLSAAVIAGGVYIVHEYNRAIGEAATLRSEKAGLERTLEAEKRITTQWKDHAADAKARAAASDKLLAERQAERDAARQRAVYAETKLAQYRRDHAHDPANPINQPVPDVVCERLWGRACPAE